MPIDRKRLAQFVREIQALQRSLSFDEFYEIVRAKVQDALARGLFKDLTLTQTRNVVSRYFRPEHQKFVAQIFDSYNQVIEIVNSHYNDLGVDISRDFAKIAAIEKINRTILGEYEESSIDQISKAIRKSLTEGLNERELRKRLIGIDDKVTVYARTIARTQVKGYARASKSEKARLAEVIFFEYVGIKRKTTRPFCRALLDTTQHIDKIRKMRNGNLEPVETYCGGWNCHHDWEPNPSFKNETKGMSEQVFNDGARRVKLWTHRDMGQIIEEYKRDIGEIREINKKRKK